MHSILGKQWKSALILGMSLSAICLQSQMAQATVNVPYTDVYTLQTYGNGLGTLVYTDARSAADRVAGQTFNNPTSAVLWDAAHPGGISYLPAGYTDSEITGLTKTQVLGNVTNSAYANHAVVWNGSPNNFVDLHPLSGFISSTVTGSDGTHQTGYGFASNNQIHALAWSSTAASAVDLHPAGFDLSIAMGTNDTHQVGFASTGGNPSHAYLWSGSAESGIDLHPADYIESAAIKVRGNQQLGGAKTNDRKYHAILWNGSASDFVDLNPAGYVQTYAQDWSEQYQVGYGTTPASTSNTHALLWIGSADSVIDLSASLSSDFVSSKANYIEGNYVYGVASTLSGAAHVIKWDITSVPEPGTLSMLIVGGLLLGRPRKIAAH